MDFDPEINRVVRALGDPVLRIGRAMLVGAGFIMGASFVSAIKIHEQLNKRVGQPEDKTPNTDGNNFESASGLEN